MKVSLSCLFLLAAATVDAQDDECPGGVDKIIVMNKEETTSKGTKSPGKGKGKTRSPGKGTRSPGKGTKSDSCPFELVCPPCVRSESDFGIVLVSDLNIFSGDGASGGFDANNPLPECLVDEIANLLLELWQAVQML